MPMIKRGKGHFKPFSLFCPFLNYPLVSFIVRKQNPFMGKSKRALLLPPLFLVPSNMHFCVPELFYHL